MIKFIAEVSSNHNKSLSRSLEFIKTAAEVGCTGIKFQLFKIDQLFSQEILLKSETHRQRKNWELPVEYIPELAEFAHSLGLEFSCTPFYLEAVDILEPYVDFFKIASYELLWHDLFRKCANTGKPLVFSTGMATIGEIKAAIDAIAGLKTTDVTILKCTSSYPTPPNEANLMAIDTFRNSFNKYYDHFNLSYGWSDHSVSSSVIFRAIYRYDAKFIEFHLDLDGKGEEFKSGHCWLPQQIKKVIEDVNEAISADGIGEISPSLSEMQERDWRADPVDGLRPLKNIRNRIIAGEIKF